jgi:alkylated DNA repair dioxygenase AlkB
LAVRTNTSATSDLFDLAGQSEQPQGFRYLPDVLSPSEEASLVEHFRRLPLQPFEFQGFLANRRIFTFGHKYAFAGQKPRADARIPEDFRPLTELAAKISGRSAEAFEQVMVTEYAPGAAIGWHRDRPSYEDIVAVSFLAPCTLRLRRKKGQSWERRSAYIEPRSIYLLHGSVRDDWQHSIAPMDVLRYSVTLRTFRPGKGIARGDGTRLTLKG